MASLTMTGSSVLLDKDSNAVLQDDELDIICGGALVKTLTALGVHVGNVEVKPSQHEAKFEAVRRGILLTITAIQGDLVVSQGSASKILKSGHRLDLKCSDCAVQKAQNPGCNHHRSMNPARCSPLRQSRIMWGQEPLSVPTEQRDSLDNVTRRSALAKNSNKSVWAVISHLPDTS